MNSSSSPLIRALKAEHPLRAFQPAPAPLAADAEGLHARIASCLSVGRPVVTKDTPEAVAHLEKLAADAKAVLDAIQQLKRKSTTPVAGEKRSSMDAMSAEAEVAHFVKRYVNPCRGGRYSALRPPPTVSEDEVNRAVAALTAEERKTLEGEFELTCLGDFEWVSDPDDPFAAVAAVSPSLALPAAAPGEAHGAEGSSSLPPGFTLTPQLDSADSLLRQCQALTSAAPTERGGNAVGFVLEAMPTAEDDQDSDDIDSYQDSEENTFNQPRLPPTGACTVEVEYTMDRWALDAQLSPALSHDSGDASGNGFTVPPFVPKPTSKAVDGDQEANGEVPLSFDKFSRLVLQQHEEEAIARLPASPADAVPQPPAQPPAQPAAQPVAQPAATTAVSATSAPSTAAEAQPTRQRRRIERQRAAFLRQRVRDVLMANKVEAREHDRLALGILVDAHKDLQAAAQTVQPVVERLAVLAKESEVLLSALDNLERSALSERLADRSQFLLVPRFRTTCNNLKCNRFFSPLVPRMSCGRCGQIFCLQCCQDRGLGPSVVCSGQNVSLGWEPLCRTCFTLCEESQRKVAAERRRRRLLGSADQQTQPTQPVPAPEQPPRRDGGDQRMPQVIFESDITDDDEVRESEEEVAKQRPCDTGSPGGPAGIPSPSVGVDQLSVKEAVLFGAYCGETRELSDGLPPFYVASSADETAAFWDVLTYRFSKLKGALLAQYQLTSLAAQRAVVGAAVFTASNVNTLTSKRLISAGGTSQSSTGQRASEPN